MLSNECQGCSQAGEALYNGTNRIWAKAFAASNRVY